MCYKKFLKKLHLDYNKVIAMTRFKSNVSLIPLGKKTCFFQYLDELFDGKILEVSANTISCPGFKSNTGLVNDIPIIPGGFENFLSIGCNKQGYPPGEKIKRTPKLALDFFNNMPKNVMGQNNALRFEIYKENLGADIVICFVTVDQLVGLTYLQNYDKACYDNAIVATTSGCASIVKIPLGELTKENPRAVIGSLDSASRIFHDKNLLTFSIPEKQFRKMISYTDECFFETSFWKTMEKRM